MQIYSKDNLSSLSGGAGAPLAAEEKVLITIAPEDGSGAWEGGINGCFFRIARGVSVEVPKSLAALISQSARVQEQGRAAVGEYRSGSWKKLGR